MLPKWLTIRSPKIEVFEDMVKYLKSLGIHTVCQSAGCPNIGECFSKRTATFMILGNICTRNCSFCGVPSGIPSPVDPDEPRRVAQAAAGLGLAYVVVTSVTRDDLNDGGASHFAETIRQIKLAIPNAKVEVLIPDFKGDEAALAKVLEARPIVLNHNVETVPRLYPAVRPQADYKRSLKILETASKLKSSIFTKSGFMVGLGESKAEVIEVLKDLRQVGCDFVTIGQYLRPSKAHLPVVEYVTPARFEEYKAIGESMGFRNVASGPFVRSSYHAADFFPT